MATTALSHGLGSTTPDFTLPNVDGRMISLSEAKGENGTVVVFICNHCPYVKAIADRLAADAATLAAEGIAMIAINSNDAANYPDDSFEKMKDFARERNFSFPYLHDESQAVARAYGAVCTPDFFGLDRDLTARYRGRLDESGRAPSPPGARRDLVEAMRQIARTGETPDGQIPSVGCSIKWKV